MSQTSRTQISGVPAAAAVPALQIGVRQRSLRRHCRLGRATELVFILATGATLVLSGGAEAQAVWDGTTSTDFADPTNYVGDQDPAGDDFILDNGAIAQPTLSAPITINTGAVSDGVLTINDALTASGGLTVTGSGTVMVGALGKITGGLLGGGGDAVNGGTIDVVASISGNFTNTTVGIVTGEMKTNGGTVVLNTGSLVGSLNNISGTTDQSGNVGGGTTVSGGTVTLNTGTNLADASTVVVSGTGMLTVNAADTVAALTQTGGTVNGSATLTTTTFGQSGGDLAGTVSASGAKTLDGGTISGTLSGAGATTIQTGATTVTGTIDGDVTVGAGGKLVIGTSNAIAGSITTTGSVVNYANGVNEASALIVNSNTTQLEVLAGAAATQSGVISELGGPRPIEKIGTGNLTLSGANTYSGLTDIAAGTLTAANSAALGTGGVEVDAGATLALTDGISIGNAIELNGTGVAGGGALVNLSGTNFVDGVVTLATDSLVTATAGADVLVLSGGVTGPNTNLTVGGAGTVTISNMTTGTGSLTVAGTGGLGLFGANTFTGGTTVDAGFLQLNGGTALADTGALTVNAPGLLQVFDGETVGDLSGAGTISLQTTDALVAGGAGDTEFSGVIEESGAAGALTKAGSGKLTLSGANTYTGVTTVTAGTLAFKTAGIARDLGDMVVNSGTLGLDNAILSVDSLSGVGGTVALTAVGGASELTFGSDGTSTEYAGAVTGTALTGLVKDGSGTTKLSGDINTAGTIAVTGGTLTLSGNNIIGGGISVDGTLRLESNTAAGGAAGSITTTGSVIDYANGVNIATGITIASNTTQVQVTTGSAEQSGDIGEDAAGRPLQKIGTGTLTFSGANTFTGDMTVSAGTLVLSGGNALADSVDLILANGATVTVQTTETIASLASVAGGTVALGSNTLNLNGAVSTSFAGNVTGGTNARLFSNAGNTTTMTGASAMTGTMGTTGGTFIMAAGSTTAAIAVGGTGATGVFTTNGGALASNATLYNLSTSITNINGSETIGSINQGAGGTINLASGAILTVNGTTNAFNLTGASSIQKDVLGAGTLNVTGGTTTVAATGQIATATTIGAGGTVVNNGTMAGVSNAGSFTNTLTAGALTNTGAGTGSNSGTLASLAHNSTGLFTNTGAVTGATSVSDGTLTLNAGTNLSDSNALTVTGGIVNVNAAETVGSLVANGGVTNVNAQMNAGSLSGTAGSIVLTDNLAAGSAGTSTSFGGVMSGAGGFQKQGGGTQTLSGANTYLGPTVVNAGTLDVTGSIASAVVTVNNAASVKVDGASLLDTAAVTLNGTSNLTLTGSETIGSLAGVLGTTVALAGNTLTTGDATSTTMAGVMSGVGGSLTKEGAGTFTLTGANTYSGPTVVNAGTLDVTGSIASAVVTVNNAASVKVDGASLLDTAAVTLNGTSNLTLTGSETIGSLAGASGTTVALAGNTLTVTNGTTTIASVMSGVGGAFTVRGTATTTLTAANTYSGATDVAENANLTIAAGASVAGAVNTSDSGVTTNDGTIFGTETTSGDGSFTNNHSVNAVVHNGGTTTNAGVIVTSLDVNADGTTNTATGTVNGDVTVDGGKLINHGTLGDAAADTVTVGATGKLDTDLMVKSAVVNDGAVRAEGDIKGKVTNQGNGTFVLTGNLLADGLDFDNTGAARLDVLAGNYTGLGVLTNASSLPFGVNIGSGFSLAATTINNSGGISVNGGTLVGAVNNSGTIALNGGTVVGGVNNTTGVITGNGASVIDGNLANSGTVSLQDSAAGDTLAVSGAISGAGNYVLDLDLGAGAADKISAAGGIANTNLNLQFNQFNSGYYGAEIDVMSGLTGNTSGLTYSGLTPTGGAISYSLVVNGSGTAQIVSSVNTAVSGVAAGAALTQSLISSVVNRPTSPFISGLAAEESCSHGGYARVYSGVATVGSTVNSNSVVSNASLDTKFNGIQAGYDIGCYDGRFFNGWDATAGVMLGFNSGSTTQKVFSDLANPTVQTGISGSKFNQSSVGLYAAAAKDRLSGDIQLRFDHTDFDLSEVVFSGSAVGLGGKSYSTNSTTFGTRLNYRMDVNEEKAINFVPTIGFNYVKTSGDTVALDGFQTLNIKSYDTVVGFVGGTLTKTVTAPDSTSFATYFVSGNYYQDFGASRQAEVISTDPLNPFTAPLEVGSIGGFAEASIGVNYLKLLENGPGGGKQLNAALRADARFGDNVSDAFSLTAQVRLSF